MKNVMKIALMVTGLFLASYSAAFAVTALVLEGNDYKVTAYCMDDAGDYCSKREIKKDVFRFEDGKLIVDSFDKGIFGLGDSGDFDENRISLTASYEVISENSLDKYAFDIEGINLIDTIIFGRMNITYSQLGITGYDKQDEAKAFFIGVKK